ncbi:uncharacterized protein LOC132707658 [Cylas formicarius]|uniref:uncharacterized protein LOC132707658 n=1 Tax=Cylas formicarius TaxID=197179 RepID=UPI0029589367|nr:uncharacterized protein LOC132707658 [Cylas formicarius]
MLLACLTVVAALAGVGSAQFVNGRKLELPVPSLCAGRTTDATSPAGSNYFYSWRRPEIDEEDWLGSRNYCRMRCMDTVSLETTAENEWIKNVIAQENVNQVWTSGRICDFKGCDREDLQPRHINGWFWTAIFKKMAPTTDRVQNDWSHTGPLGTPQPDTTNVIQHQTENCLAILNNHYGDGIRWHDVPCNKRRFFICEDSDELLRYVRYTNPELHIR